MRQVKPFLPAHRAKMASNVAGGQWGVIGSVQLRNCGFSTSAVDRWVEAGKLYSIHPGVYAYGHSWIPIEGRMVAAILHAGEGAVLSHATAAWWWGLIADQPDVLDVSTSGRARSTNGVRVHHPRRIDAARHRRFPITTVARTLVDHAAHAPLSEVRRALAEAEYRRLLDLAKVESYLVPGRRGSRRLRRALARHEPRLALTRSDTERRFLRLCERIGVPGYMVIRYTWSQVAHEADLVATDLTRQLSSLGRSGGPGSR